MQSFRVYESIPVSTQIHEHEICRRGKKKTWRSGLPKPARTAGCLEPPFALSSVLPLSHQSGMYITRAYSHAHIREVGTKYSYFNQTVPIAQRGKKRALTPILRCDACLLAAMLRCPSCSLDHHTLFCSWPVFTIILSRDAE